MGMVFGKMGVESPKYQVIRKVVDYEIRKYAPSVVAEITYSPSQFKGDADGGFGVLAGYIGAFTKPQNTKAEKVSMTVPVVTSTSEKISMTVPVITSGEGSKTVITMQFVLPSKYEKAEEAPKPVDERVVVRQVGERMYGVLTFGGVASKKVVAEKVEFLSKSLERDGYKVTGDFLLARFNPPWITLPPFRTNEVMIPVQSDI